MRVHRSAKRLQNSAQNREGNEFGFTSIRSSDATVPVPLVWLTLPVRASTQVFSSVPQIGFVLIPDITSAAYKLEDKKTIRVAENLPLASRKWDMCKLVNGGPPMPDGAISHETQYRTKDAAEARDYISIQSIQRRRN